MPKAFVDLDMNSNDINSAANTTATTQHRANSHFDANGLNGLTQSINLTTNLVNHSFIFQGGILISHSTKK